VWSNRSACCAALGRWIDALSDADGAVGADPQFAKAHSRRGVALMQLGRVHQAAAAFATAVKLDGSNADARQGLEEARKSGGHSRLADEEKRKQSSQKKDAIDEQPRSAVAPAATAVHAERLEAARREYEMRLARVRKQRREAIAKWRTSTGTDLHAPEADRGTSIRVDIFGRLRGAAPALGCTMWMRDVATAAHWSDTKVLTCQNCGGSNEAHDDCGSFEVDDPPEPTMPGTGADHGIAGVNRAVPGAGVSSRR